VSSNRRGAQITPLTAFFRLAVTHPCVGRQSSAFQLIAALPYPKGLHGLSLRPHPQGFLARWVHQWGGDCTRFCRGLSGRSRTLLRQNLGVGGISRRSDFGTGPWRRPSRVDLIVLREAALRRIPLAARSSDYRWRASEVKFFSGVNPGGWPDQSALLSRGAGWGGRGLRYDSAACRCSAWRIGETRRV
jgi:hypothetical protein